MSRRTLFVAALAALAACQAAPRGRPQSRLYTITAVPLLTREMQRVYPFLTKDFAPGGLLAGREVYAFEPSTITVYEGDTLQLNLINPEDDAHTFSLLDLHLTLQPMSIVKTAWVARRAGIFRYECDLPTHQPFMYGTLVVLPAAESPAP